MTKSIENLYSECQEFRDLIGKGIPYHCDMEIKQIIANWIKRARSQAGLSGDALGDKLGVSKQNISSWENQRHEPSISQIVRIAQICRQSLPAELAIENRLTDEALRFALAYQLLPKELRKQIADALTTAEIAARNLQDQ